MFQGVLVLVLLRQLSRVSRLADKDELPGEDRSLVGSRIPRWLGSEQISGARVESSVFNNGGGIVLFLAASCSVCKGLISSIQSSGAQLGPIIAFCVGREAGCSKLSMLPNSNIRFVQGADEAATRFHVSGFPTAVIIDENRTVRAYGHPRTAHDLGELWPSTFRGSHIPDGASEKSAARSTASA